MKGTQTRHLLKPKPVLLSISKIWELKCSTFLKLIGTIERIRLEEEEKELHSIPERGLKRKRTGHQDYATEKE